MLNPPWQLKDRGSSKASCVVAYCPCYTAWSLGGLEIGPEVAARSYGCVDIEPDNVPLSAGADSMAESIY